VRPIILVGTISVTLALIIFTIVTIKLQKSKMLNKGILTGYSLGVILDFTALMCMSFAATHPPFTIHGIIGYSAFLLMAGGVVWAIRTFRKGTIELPENVGQYLKYIYGYWALAYFTGAFMSTLA
jgi:hypothetical protein